jgi:SAM-dependent methyltransferase
MIKSIVRRMMLATLGRHLELPAARRRLLARAGASEQERALLRNVSLALHSADGMYKPMHPDHYLRTGLSAMRCIERAMSGTGAAGREDLRMLDFPSGYGRVSRFLRARWPAAELSVAELEVAATQFCCESFRARTVPTSSDFDSIALGSTYDLIWCGSLVTHFDEARTTALVRMFARHLAPGGVCLFTAHGDYPAGRLASREADYGLTEGACRRLVDAFRDDGYGYEEYASIPGYGVSLVTHARMTAIATSAGDWRELSFEPRGWDNHQDVYAYAR